jgi:hypothetical protein
VEIGVVERWNGHGCTCRGGSGWASLARCGRVRR